LIGGKGTDGSTDDDNVNDDAVGNRSLLLAKSAQFEMRFTLSAGVNSIIVVGLTNLRFSLWYGFHLLKRTSILLISGH
jgi:hypothetical protein